MKKEKDVRTPVIAVGFGLYKAAAGLSYSTAMGSVSSGIGFVSELDFMFAMNGVSALTALAIFSLIYFGKVEVWRLSYIPAAIALSFGFVLGSTGFLASLPIALTTATLGVLCGAPIVILCAAWLEVLAAQETAKAVVQLIGGLFMQMTLVFAAPLLPLHLVSFLLVLALVVSALAFCWARRVIEPPRYESSWKALGAQCEQRTVLIRSYICLFVLVGVVGIMHTSVLSSASEHIVGGVNMQLPRMISLGLAAFIAILMVRRPNPTVIYKICFPCILVILSLLPFFGEMLGSLVGLVVITCYEICGTIFLLFIIEQSRSLKFSTYLLSVAYMGGSSFVLFLGLALGLVLSAISVELGLSLLTLLSFAAIYPLVIVLILVVRKGQEPVRAKAEPSADTPQLLSEKGENAFSQRVDEFARSAELTKRETEILRFLVRGRSARYIAETLVISENTVWAHIKRVYAKTGLHSKQEIMSAVEGCDFIR